MVQHISDATTETINIEPPAAETLWTFAGLSLDEVIAYLTILYLLALLAEKVAKWFWTWKRRRG